MPDKKKLAGVVGPLLMQVESIALSIRRMLPPAAWQKKNRWSFRQCFS
jgi:hypothetical protein